MHEIKESIIAWASSFPPEWATFLMAMVPVTELRASIPVSMTLFGLSWGWAFFFSFLGNLFLGAVVLFIGEATITYLVSHNKRLSDFWHHYIERIKTKNTKKFRTWGSLALILFVAIPLPMTGAFSGAVAASIFKIPYWQALKLLAVGLFIAGSIVTALTLWTMKILQ